jgi:hypothetical protein
VAVSRCNPLSAARKSDINARSEALKNSKNALERADPATFLSLIMSIFNEFSTGAPRVFFHQNRPPIATTPAEIQNVPTRRYIICVTDAGTI